MDRESFFPGMQLFEKMISGMYLGELVRLVIMDLNINGRIFSSKISLDRDSFETAFMSRIERDHSRDLADTKSVLEDLLKIPSTSLNDRQLVKTICELVSIRASRLSAAAIGAVIQKIHRLEGCNVAIDGSLFEHYPHFQNRMKDALRELFSISSDNIRLSLARDGSGIGAALIAMLAKQ